MGKSVATQRIQHQSVSQIALSTSQIGACEEVTGYLIHDILRMQSEKVRNFVLATALLDRFTPELCAEVAGSSNGDRMLAKLRRMNLFLIPLDAERKWYRYHHMLAFRAYLLSSK